MPRLLTRPKKPTSLTTEPGLDTIAATTLQSGVPVPAGMSLGSEPILVFCLCKRNGRTRASDETLRGRSLR